MKWTTSFLMCSMLMLFLASCSQNKELQALEDATIFTVASDQQAIRLEGTINSSAYDQFRAVAEANPTIKQLDIVYCDGSINDDVNLRLAKYVHEKGFNIHLLDEGLIASGGTDLFLAGHTRTLGKNTKVGVHAWSDGSNQATDFPRGHKNHLPYIEYYTTIGFTQQEAEDFYYFTIHAAPAEDVHWMTPAEIVQYKVTTK